MKPYPRTFLWLVSLLLAALSSALLTGCDEAALRKALAREFNTLIEREMPERWKLFEDIHRIHGDYAQQEANEQDQSKRLQESVQGQANVLAQKGDRAGVQLAQQTLARIQAESAARLQAIQAQRDKAKQERRDAFFNSPAPFAWGDVMAFGFGVLRRSSRELWAMTPRELAAAAIAINGPARERLSLASFSALMRAFTCFLSSFAATYVPK